MAAPSPHGSDSDPNANLAKPRRGHTKSRAGCLECKRRHIRCDERHPICANCDMAERQCVYTGESLKVGKHASLSTGREPRSISSAPQILLQSPRERSSSALSCSTSFEGGPVVNFLHLELLHNFTRDTFAIGFGQDFPDPTQLIVESGFHAPYLMYEALAISACRLASLNHSKRSLYLHEAMLLQTHALSLFNTDKEEICESSCVARLLFSSLLGRHLLSDTLVNRAGGFISFLERYVQFLRLHRSMRNIAADAYPFLMQSELAPAISWGTAILDIHTTGHHCDSVLRLISSANLDDTVREACRQAVHFLQVGFDEAQGERSQWRTIHVIFWWSILLPPEFVDLLARLQPEAIVILGYYSALLHYGKEIWLIGDAGTFLLDAITQYLGHDWAEWMAGPRALIVGAQ